MPQIFRRSTNTISRVSIASLLILVASSFWLISAVYDSPYVTQVRVIREQPIPFSHQHHSGELGIDCRYCHTSVEKSSFAGIPASSVCMNCHSQIWTTAEMLEPVRKSYKTGSPIEWTRVHNLPDFAYFDHSIHVAKGIGCVSCHGRVDKMALMWKTQSLWMRWCLDCHRDPAQHIRPKDQIVNMEWAPPGNKSEQLVYRKKLVDEHHVRSQMECYACHR